MSGVIHRLRRFHRVIPGFSLIGHHARRASPRLQNLYSSVRFRLPPPDILNNNRLPPGDLTRKSPDQWKLWRVLKRFWLARRSRLRRSLRASARDRRRNLEHEGCSRAFGGSDILSCCVRTFCHVFCSKTPKNREKKGCALWR